MSYPVLWLCLGVLMVAVGSIWLRRMRDRFIDELRSTRDPLADGPKDKEFRKAFQIWLLRQIFDNQAGKSRGSDVLVALGVATLIGLGIFSFIGSTE
ncbi:MAG: hypothetical protein AAF501_16645 [Pseudomonadota bacterium]